MFSIPRVIHAMPPAISPEALRAHPSSAHPIYSQSVKLWRAPLPESFDRIIRLKQDRRTRARILCDYIAGMTDGFAIRTYKRLYDPDFGSLLDIG
jgi:dGTP triphosphohydrolase